MFDQFTHLVAQASGWAYVVIFVFAALDAVLPVVPSETAVITAGVVASSGDLLLPVVVVAAAGGAFAGDNLGYGLGHRYGGRLLRGEKGRRRVAWAQRQLDRRGGELIAVGRFIPGGRTAVTVTAGLSGFPWPRFARYDALAAVVWGCYAAGLGYFGGQAFEGEAWKGLLLALGIAFAVAAATEGVRALLHHRKRRAEAAAGAADAR